MSLKAFCRRHNLDRSTLIRPGLPGQRQNPTAQNPWPPGWVRVEPARNFDTATLRQLLRLLDSQ